MTLTASPVCILYTQDADLARRAKAFLRVLAQVRHVTEADRLDAVLQQAGPAVLLLDLRAKDARDLLGQIQKEWPEILITALGTLRSEPLREAEQACNSIAGVSRRSCRARLIIYGSCRKIEICAINQVSSRFPSRHGASIRCRSAMRLRCR
jgi:hypothetical protein